MNYRTKIFMNNTAQKMKFSIKNFFSKCDQIHRKLRVWSHLLKKSLMENFVFHALLCKCVFICVLFVFICAVQVMFLKKFSPLVCFLRLSCVNKMSKCDDRDIQGNTYSNVQTTTGVDIDNSFQTV